MRAFFAFIPRPLRLSVFAAAVAVVLYLSLAPTEDIPGAELVWDKAAHAGVYTLLTLIGLLFSTHRRGLVVLAIWGLGIGIEFAQMAMGFGRHGDWHDALANSIGIAAGVVLWAVARRFKPGPKP